jgi:hypothetical protein
MTRIFISAGGVNGSSHFRELKKLKMHLIYDFAISFLYLCAREVKMFAH